ncbi:hypothetical protein [Amycolatopsis sp. H20-H5]|uniref:hypothetical protein n=1 Tax=Amycolatopsis sp. H20-H5 TaxID=3046309 RepID=UPI002DC03D2D|nr:hypothetical protein [Amycolatopsis sp. H20-H5]MEC3977901.1 hypothetical protein [Amycolatopsis sp. H20-H5]
MATRVYATRGDLPSATPAGNPVPAGPEATRLLTSASRLIERATKAAVYATNAAFYPTDPDIRDALRDATCEQALWWLDNPGEESGATQQYASVAIGTVKLDRGTGSTGGVPGQRLAPQADTVLSTAGLLPGHIVQIQTWEGAWF